MSKFILLAFFICCVINHGFAAKDTTATHSVQLLATIDSSYIDSQSIIQFSPILDETLIQTYTVLIQKEIVKYPFDFFEKIKISKIIIVSNLRLDKQSRAAIPAPSRGILYLNAHTDYSEDYIVHVFHHELHHCTEFSQWGDMYYSWKKWDRRNHKSFEYGSGGADAYTKKNIDIDWYSPTHPQHGFVNLYATLGPEEDRCELVALIMSDTERHFLFEIAKKDKRIRRKIKLLLDFLNDVSDTRHNYWKKIMHKTY